jgi:hypothetical protein
VSKAVVVLHPASAAAKLAISMPRAQIVVARRRATLRMLVCIKRLLVASLNRE